MITRACVHIVLQTSGYLMHDYSSQCRWIAVDSFFRGSVNTHRYSPPLPWISVNQFIQASFRYNKLWVSLRENLARENTFLIFSATKTAGSLAHDVMFENFKNNFWFQYQCVNELKRNHRLRLEIWVSILGVFPHVFAQRKFSSMRWKLSWKFLEEDHIFQVSIWLVKLCNPFLADPEILARTAKAPWKTPLLVHLASTLETFSCLEFVSTQTH